MPPWQVPLRKELGVAIRPERSRAGSLSGDTAVRRAINGAAGCEHDVGHALISHCLEQTAGYRTIIREIPRGMLQRLPDLRAARQVNHDGNLISSQQSSDELHIPGITRLALSPANARMQTGRTVIKSAPLPSSLNTCP